MIDLLRQFRYRPPVIVPGHYGRLEIRQDPHGCFFIYVDGEQWMCYNQHTHEQVYEVFSHYDLAQGHVMVTGMGFGARENWLLTRPEVTRLTIIEHSPEIIQYHHSINSAFLRDPRVEIIHHDAQTYQGQCDVLLLDHFEMEPYHEIIELVKVCQQNIACDVMWFWPLEHVIKHSRRWYSQQDGVLINKHQAYQRLQSDHALYRLPALTPQRIDLYVMMASSYLFSRSEHMLSTRWPGIEANWELYGQI